MKHEKSYQAAKLTKYSESCKNKYYILYFISWQKNIFFLVYLSFTISFLFFRSFIFLFFSSGTHLSIPYFSHVDVVQA